MWVRIQNDRIAEVILTDPAGRFPAGVMTVAVPAEMQGLLPSTLQCWCWSGDQIVADVAALRQALRARLRQRRRTAALAGVALPGGQQVATDDGSLLWLALATIWAQRSPAAIIPVPTAVGEVTPMTAAQVEALFDAIIGGFGMAVMAREMALAADLSAAADQAGLMAIAEQIDQGWPS